MAHISYIYSNIIADLWDLISYIQTVGIGIDDSEELKPFIYKSDRIRITYVLHQNKKKPYRQPFQTRLLNTVRRSQKQTFPVAEIVEDISGEFIEDISGGDQTT